VFEDLFYFIVRLFIVLWMSVVSSVLIAGVIWLGLWLGGNVR
jgi:hypothetical protein